MNARCSPLTARLCPFRLTACSQHWRNGFDGSRHCLTSADRVFGKERVRIGSYMENLGWPELFGFDMNRYFDDPCFMLETELRQRIFWSDNSNDDGLPNMRVSPTVGMYFDITMFGQRVWHEASGVPQFEPHAIQNTPDLSLIPPIDFYTSGAMPNLLRQHKAILELNRDRYAGALAISFPGFGRGPFDVAIQLRTYEKFIEDTMERPEFVHAFLSRIVRERTAWNREHRRYLGESEPIAPQTWVDDDWINIPLLSPDMIREFALPVYQEIVRLEGKVVGFHTCGRLEAVVTDLLKVFGGITCLDVSGWNDFELLDEFVDPKVAFGINLKNTFVLTGTPEQHREVLRHIARVGKRRGVSICTRRSSSCIRLMKRICHD